MKKVFAFIALAIACAVQEFEANQNGHFELTEEQMDTLEAKLQEQSEALKNAEAAQEQAQKDHDAVVAQKDAEIAELKAQIDALNKQPGAETTEVHNNGGGDHNPESQSWDTAQNWAKEF